MSRSPPDLTLYDLKGCPYCAKVRRALDDLDLEYERIEVPPARRDRSEVYAVSGQRKVPVLVDRSNGIGAMPESRDIVAYLYAEYGTETDSPPEGVLDRLLGRMR